ncbi:MAG: hypothetical protein KatS3mg094_297 [Candidatus Parcubacteria bacterium]|nr:MAG: hypothetical protein KatS3mg094_297 [Candidatus Parcubacteria bacterium]
MNRSKFFLISLLVNTIILLFFLFIPNFNYLKLSIFALLILNLFFLFILIGLKKEEIITGEEDFYLKLDKIFNLINNPLVVYDKEMKVLYINNAFEKFIGLDKKLIINFKIDTWIIKNEKYLKLALIFFPSLTAENIKIIKSGDPDIIDISYKNEIFISIINTKVNYNKKEFNLKIILDHSQEIKQNKQSLELLDLLAHHLRTPLNQLKWLIEENKELIDKSIYNQEIDIINRALFLTQMIILSRKTEEGDVNVSLELNSIQELINSCLSLFKSSLEDKNIKVEVYLDEAAEKFYFDKNIIFSIMLALIENAIDYNKPNGKIIFNINKDLDRNYIVIKISDTGIGMSEDDLNNIFKKYFRSNEAKEIKPIGFGLGLYLVYSLTKAHKGNIRVESKKNIGTTFILEFPANKEIYNL